MKKFNKATAAALGVAVTTVIAALFDLEPEIVGSIGTLVTALLVWLVPNVET